MLASFQKAIYACEEYRTVILHSRGNMPAQYDLLAITYLAYRDGLRPGNRAIYKSQIRRQLGRDITTPEKKRPFLLLLHALFGDELDQSMQRRMSKMTTGLEQIDAEFAGRSSTQEVIVDYIQSCGGINGLWTKAKPVNDTGRRQYSKVRHNLTNVEGGSIVKDVNGHALHLDFEPGEYLIRAEVSKSGRVKIKRTAKARIDRDGC